MTKIKNTKKGMAKKTLSMSLVVAMLATSNVPVWAAEFSDGTEAAFTSEAEAPAAEEEASVAEAEAPVVEDNTTDAVDAQSTGDAWTVKLTGLKSEIEWGTPQDDVKVEVKDIDGKEVTGATSGLKYVWKNVATGLAVDEEKAIATSVPMPATTSDNVGDQYVLFIYDESGEWTYTSSTVTVGAQDITGDYDIIYKDKSGKEIKGDRVYTGKETDKNAVVDDDKVKFDIDYTGDLVNVGTVKVTARPVDTKLYKGVIETSFDITPAPLATNTSLVKATLNTKEVEYTGDKIVLKKADVNVADANTGADLNDLVDTEKDINTGIKNVTDEPVAVNVPLKAAESVKNFSGSADVTTADKVKVVARDLSKVKVTIVSKGKTPDGKAYEKKDLTLHFTDANGKTLYLDDAVSVEGLDKAINFGTYTVTIKPAKDNKNVTGQTTAEFSIFSEDISAAHFFDEKGLATIAVQNYTGEQIKPDVSKLKVKLGNKATDKELDPSDYTIEYGENVNAGKGYIYIVGKRTYEGSKATIEFDINKATVKSDDIKAAEYVVVDENIKDAKDYAQAIGLVVKGKNGATPAKEFTLTEGKDYIVTYKYKNATTGNQPGNTIVAEVKVNPTGNGNFEAVNATGSPVLTLTKEIRIAKPIIKDADIKMNQTSYEYTGAVITPDFDVVVNGKTLKKGTDYVIDNVVDSAKVGTATVYIKGAGEYDDQVKAKATFTVTPVSAEKTVVSVDGDYEYTGKAQKPDAKKITVKLNGNDVTGQFDITYGENINAGEKAGTVTVTPKKDNQNFTAGTSQTGTFKIAAAKLTGTLKVYDERGIAYTINGDKIQKNSKTVEFDYDGVEKTFAKVVFTPNITGDKKVTEDDYEIKYVNNVTGGGEDTNAGASIVVIAKGNYEANGTVKDNSATTAVTVKNVVTEAKFKINSKLYFTEKEVTVTDAEYAGSNMLAAPTIVVKDGNKVLKEGTDYTVKLTYKDGNAIETGVNAIGTYNWEVTGTGVYAEKLNGKNHATGEWKVTKKDVANLDITVDLDANGEPVLTVMNGNLKVDNKNFTVTLSDDKKTATVAATTGNKYYIGSKEIELEAEDAKVGQAIISDVIVNGNTVTPVLSSEADGAVGYDYVLATEENTTDGRIDISKNILSTHTNFYYVPEGTYYVYCHAWKRGEDGKKVFGEWSNIKEVKVEATTPSTPTITSVKVKGSTVTVTYTESENATGYDVVLGTSVKKVNGERRPVEYGKLVKKNVEEGTVEVTFTNVPSGTYYAGLHAYNRTSANASKVFSKWSNHKTVRVK